MSFLLLHLSSHKECTVKNRNFFYERFKLSQIISVVLGEVVERDGEGWEGQENVS